MLSIIAAPNSTFQADGLFERFNSFFEAFDAPCFLQLPHPLRHSFPERIEWLEVR